MDASTQTKPKLTIPSKGSDAKALFYSKEVQEIDTPWFPDEQDIEEFQKTVREQQAVDFKKVIAQTAYNLSNFIDDTNKIQFSPTSVDVYQKIYENSSDEKKFDMRKNGYINDIKGDQAVAINNPNTGVCTVSVPSQYSNTLSKDAITDLRGESDGDSESLNAIVSDTAAHEFAHCVSEHAKHGNIDDEIISTLNNFEVKNTNYLEEAVAEMAPSYKKMAHNNPEMEAEMVIGSIADRKVLQLPSEVLADSFSTLKTQQEYFIQNRDAIDSGDKPLLSPTIEKLFLHRLNNTHKHGDHDTSDEVGILITVLSNKKNCEALAKASDERLMVTAYDLMAKTYEFEFNQSVQDKLDHITDNHVMSNKIEISFPDNYLKNHEKPLYDFKLNDNFINRNTKEVEEKLKSKESDNNDKGFFSRFGL